MGKPFGNTVLLLIGGVHVISGIAHYVSKTLSSKLSLYYVIVVTECSGVQHPTILSLFIITTFMTNWPIYIFVQK